MKFKNLSVELNKSVDKEKHKKLIFVKISYNEVKL